MGLPGGSIGKDSACNAGAPRSIPGAGRSPGEGSAIYSSILDWRMPRTEEPADDSPWGLKESDTT